MDINAIKQRLTSLQQKPKPKYEKIDRTKIFWKPKIGKQVIRILPSKFNSENPFKEVFFHYNIAKFPMLALTNYGEKDPIVDFSKELKKTNDKENWKMGKKLEPKMRVFVPVLVRGEEELGARLWEFGKETYQELLSIAEDEDIGDYTSITNGHDFTVDTVGPEVTGTKFNKSSVRVKPKVTAITEDKALLERVLNEQPDVLSIYPKKTYEEVKELLQDFLSPKAEEAETEETEDETEETGDEKSTESVFKEDPKTQVKKSNSDAFASLFEKK
jgi:hypothetical protein